MSGLYFDEIDEVGNAINFSDFYTNDEAQVDQRELDRIWVERFRQAEDMLQRKVPTKYHNGQARLEVFWRTIIGDKDKAGRPASPEYYYNYLEFRVDCLRKHFKLLKDAPWEREELTKSEQDVLETRARDSRS
jgi:hypothetical protein